MVTIRQDAVLWPNGRSILLKDFPQLLAQHRNSDPTTSCIEKYGAEFVAAGFPEDRALDFVSHVCTWAKDNRRRKRILDNNTPAHIKTQLEAAYDVLLRNDAKGAIRIVSGIYGCSVSYGSKHLRFLHPERVVILDRFIREALDYKDSPKGLEEFLNDCIEIRDTLDKRKIPIDRSRPRWRVSDVEMAIFVEVKPN